MTQYSRIQQLISSHTFFILINHPVNGEDFAFDYDHLERGYEAMSNCDSGEAFYYEPTSDFLAGLIELMTRHGQEQSFEPGYGRRDTPALHITINYREMDSMRLVERVAYNRAGYDDVPF